MIVDQRIYRTADGRLCSEGDPEAAFLVYPAGTELSDEEARRAGLLEEKKPAAKMADKLADKAADKPADKAFSMPAETRRGPGRPRKSE